MELKNKIASLLFVFILTVGSIMANAQVCPPHSKDHTNILAHPHPLLLT